MASFSGKSGAVTLDAGGAGADVIFFHISGWTMDWSREDHVITDFDSTEGWDDVTVGLAKITGTLEGFYQDAAEAALDEADLILDGMDMVLTAKSGKTFTFSACVDLRNFNLTSEVGVPNRWTASFVANAAPTIA